MTETLVNYSQMRRDKASKEPKKLIIHDLTEEDLQDLIKALILARAAHDELVQDYGKLMNPEERTRHLQRASRYNDLSVKLQGV